MARPRSALSADKGPLGELIKASGIFARTLKGAEKALNQPFALKDKDALEALNEALQAAFGGLKDALRSVSPQLEAITREAEMQAKIAAQDAEIARLQECLRAAGHRDKVAGPANKLKGQLKASAEVAESASAA